MEIALPSPCQSCGQSLVPADVNRTVYFAPPIGDPAILKKENRPHPSGEPEYIPLTDLCLSCLFTLERRGAWQILNLVGDLRGSRGTWIIDCMPGYRFGEEWADFSILMFGNHIGYVRALADSHPFDTGKVSWAADYRPDGDRIFVTQAWLRRVRYRDTPLYLEERWNPTMPKPGVALHGLEEDVPTSEANEAMRRGRKLLQATSQRGRPPGGRFDSPEECREAVATAIEERVRAVHSFDAADRKFSQDDIAQMLFGIDNGARQLRRALKPYKWQEIVDEVLKANP